MEVYTLIFYYEEESEGIALKVVNTKSKLIEEAKKCVLFYKNRQYKNGAIYHWDKKEHILFLERREK